MCVCFSLALPQEMTRCYKSCSYITTFGFFAKNEAEFLDWITGAKLGEYFINFGVVVVPDMFIFWAFCEEVQLRVCHSQHEVRAESVLTREPDCVHCSHRQFFPEFHITHGAQVDCNNVFSI